MGLLCRGMDIWDDNNETNAGKIMLKNMMSLRLLCSIKMTFPAGGK